MKKMILLMVVLGLVLTAGIVSAGEFMQCRCWRLDPYQDTIKVCNPTGAPIAYNYFPAVLVGSWIIDVSGGVAPPHKLLIPLTGTMQKDLSGKFALELQGTARDLTLQAEDEGVFSRPCYIQAILKADFSSASFPFPPPNGPLKSSVSAWCEDYFGDNPFITPNFLKPIACYDNPDVRNPVNGGEIGEDF